MRYRLLLPLLAALLATLVSAAGAGAADTHAPKGARLDWLPTDEWVMSAWMPFDEARLDAVVKTDHAELTSWLDDHRTLVCVLTLWSSDRTMQGPGSNVVRSGLQTVRNRSEVWKIEP